VQARTAELVRTNEQVQAEIVEHKRAEEALRRSEAYLTESQRLTHHRPHEIALQESQSAT